jgi:hypothetical protein
MQQNILVCGLAVYGIETHVKCHQEDCLSFTLFFSAAVTVEFFSHIVTVTNVLFRYIKCKKALSPSFVSGLLCTPNAGPSPTCKGVKVDHTSCSIVFLYLELLIAWSPDSLLPVYDMFETRTTSSEARTRPLEARTLEFPMSQHITGRNMPWSQVLPLWVLGFLLASRWTSQWTLPVCTRVTPQKAVINQDHLQPIVTLLMMANQLAINQDFPQAELTFGCVPGMEY